MPETDQNFLDELFSAQEKCPDCPSPGTVADFFERLIGILFPPFSEKKFKSKKEIDLALEELRLELTQILERNAYQNDLDGTQTAKDFFKALPEIRQHLLWDVDAMYEGDPAAKSRSEVVRTYPGFLAIAAYRVAHKLHCSDIVMIPRMITEYAHGKTGIDIHPGAKIADHFCIDHGTGSVIGETTEIGSYVKLYQGVTLGGLSVNKADASLKRHPTIKDRVVIYAGATILGGETEVGENSIVGGNVWLTQSIPPNSKVYYQARLTSNSGDMDTITIK